MKRGQAAMEYLAVVGFALLMIVPIIIIFFTQSEDITEQLTMNQVREIGRKITSTAEKIYYLGEPSQTTLKVYMPNHVQGISIQPKALVINVTNGNSVSEVVFPSSVPIQGNLSHRDGIRFVKVKSLGGEVNISDA